MNTKNCHEFTLWIHDCESNEEKVSGMIFEEGYSYDEILLTMLALDQLGFVCSLTCETWTQHVKNESEDIDND